MAVAAVLTLDIVIRFLSLAKLHYATSFTAKLHRTNYTERCGFESALPAGNVLLGASPNARMHCNAIALCECTNNCIHFYCCRKLPLTICSRE